MAEHQNPVRICISQNLVDHDAYIESDTGCRARGTTAAQAIGNLILTYPDKFCIEILGKGISSRRGGYEERSVPDSGTSVWPA